MESDYMFKYNRSKFYEKMIFKLSLICTSYWSRRKYHNILSDADWVGTVNLILQLCEISWWVMTVLSSAC